MSRNKRMSRIEVAGKLMEKRFEEQHAEMSLRMGQVGERVGRRHEDMLLSLTPHWSGLARVHSFFHLSVSVHVDDRMNAWPGHLPGHVRAREGKGKAARPPLPPPPRRSPPCRRLIEPTRRGQWLGRACGGAPRGRAQGSILGRRGGGGHHSCQANEWDEWQGFRWRGGRVIKAGICVSVKACESELVLRGQPVEASGLDNHLDSISRDVEISLSETHCPCAECAAWRSMLDA